MSLDYDLIRRIAERADCDPSKVRIFLRELDESNVRLKAIAEFRKTLAQGGRPPGAASEKQ